MFLFVSQNKEFVTLVSTVILAFIGYIIEYLNDLSIANDAIVSIALTLS